MNGSFASTAARASRRALLQVAPPLALAILMVGCALPRTSRTADVLKPGVMEVAITGGGATGDAQVSVVGFDGDNEVSSAGSSEVVDAEDGGAVGAFSLLILQPRLGLFDPCELGLDLGLSRLGGEFRCRGLEESGEIAPALTWWTAGAWKPLGGWDASTGIDVSRWFGGMFAPFVNIGVTFGSFTHVMPLDVRLGRADIDRLEVRIEEVAARIDLGFGGALRFGDDPDYATVVTLAAAPHFTVWSLNPPGAECDDCVRIDEVRAFDESWGLVFTVSVGQRFRIWDE